MFYFFERFVRQYEEMRSMKVSNEQNMKHTENPKPSLVVRGIAFHIGFKAPKMPTS